MKKTLFLSLFIFICYLNIHAQAVYVDSNIGNDNNAGSENAPVFSISKASEIISRKDNNIYVMKISPGIYILDEHISIATQKSVANKRIVIEASILPDDSLWAPEKMPVIVSKATKGEIPEDFNFVVSLLINESHITIRGIKFPGYFYPNTMYFPVARFNKSKIDLTVEKCMFVGDANASHIQVGVIAHGNEIKVDHCIFFNAKNGVVYWEDSGNGSKTGNTFTNNIVYGAFQSAIWTAWPDNDFVFKNNIITNCKHAWVKNPSNSTKYTIEDCIIVNNQYYQGAPHENGVVPEKFEVNEKNVIQEGRISLKMIEEVDKPLPLDYLHVIPGSLGYDLGAGLFKTRKP